MIKETRTLLQEKNQDLLEELSKSDRELYNAFTHNYSENKYDSALQNLLEIRNKNDFVHGMLGFLYETYLHNWEKAESHYIAAVDQGNASMLINLANLYEVELEDYDKAREYYLKSAKEGNINALFRLALMYEEKLKDYKKAARYYSEAVNKGHSDAMNNLALLHQNVYRDYEMAQKYFKLAIEEGHIEAMNHLAWLYFIQKTNKGEYACMDGERVICRMDIKQCDETKIDDNTSNVFIYVQGNKATSDKYIRTALKQACENIIKSCGGKYKIL